MDLKDRAERLRGLIEIERMTAEIRALRIAAWRPAPPERARLCRLARCRRHRRCCGTAERDCCPLPSRADLP